jgi:hypothetical protein
MDTDTIHSTLLAGWSTSLSLATFTWCLLEELTGNTLSSACSGASFSHSIRKSFNSSATCSQPRMSRVTMMVRGRIPRCRSLFFHA